MAKWLSIVISGLLIGADDGKKPDQNKKDLDQMQGSWRAIAMEHNGQAKGPDEIKKFRLVVKKDEFVVKVNGEDHVSGKLVLRADKKPKEMDWTLETGPVYKGIYQIDGDKLTICVRMGSDPDSERPKDFTTTENSGTGCMTWERME